MSNIPSMRAMKEEIDLYHSDKKIIICQSCKKRLWTLSNFKQYGSKWSCDKEAAPGVPEYNDIWSKDGTSCSEVLCWFCGEPWMKAVNVEGKVFCKPEFLAG